MFFILIFTMLLVGCNGSENTSSSENHSAALLRIDIVASPIATKGASLLKLAKGNVQAFIATGYYSDGTVQDITNIVSWATSKVTIATVTSAGLLTGIDAGVTNIVATKDGITSNSLGLEVTNAAITAIQVTPAAVSVAKGQTKQLTAMATYSDSTTADVTTSVAWQIVDSNIATVTSAGLLTGIDAGVTNIVATKDGITSNSLGLEVTRWVSVPAVADYLVPDFVARNKADADAYCDSIQIDGSRWRVPSKDELLSLYNAYPTFQVSNVLGWKTNFGYWSSTADITTTNSFWAIVMHDGYVGSALNSGNLYVTCVR